MSDTFSSQEIEVKQIRQQQKCIHMTGRPASTQIQQQKHTTDEHQNSVTRFISNICGSFFYGA